MPSTEIHNQSHVRSNIRINGLAFKALFQCLFKDRNRKTIFQMLSEMAALFRKNRTIKIIPSYFINMKYKEDSGEINDYIPWHKFPDIYNKYYRKEGIHPILGDKISMVQFFHKNGISCTKSIGYIKNGKIALKSIREEKIVNIDHLKKELLDLLDIYDDYFLKESKSQGASGIYKVSRSNIEKIPLSLDKNYLIEESIVQHPELNLINPDCINTLRVITYKKNDVVKIASCFFRMGIQGASVDNASAGGVFVSYDIHTNQLGKMGYKKFKYGGQSFFKHPDTKFEFEKKNLPYPNHVIELVKKAASLIDLEMIGWDIAYTEKGPLIIEGNDNPAIDSLQVANRGVLHNPVYKKAYQGYY